MNTIGVGAKLSHSSSATIVQAINGISFKAIPGDRIGLIGNNGAGKTTLLKLIAGIYQPTYGKLRVSGKIGTFLENQTLLNLEATGFENIKLSGCLKGWSRSKQIQINEYVAAFTELGDFLNLPVNCYSNGMLGRLTLSLALLDEPDILLVDENIGAGDAEFQERVSKNLSALIHKVDILVVASHSNAIIEKYCNKAVVMNKGKIAFFGSVNEAIHYHKTRA